LEFGASVTVADDLSSGTLANLTQAEDTISFRKGDLKDRKFAESVAEGADVVFHLAARHGGRGYIASHPADCASNMAIDSTVIEASWKRGVERICFASSACVYPKSLQSRNERLHAPGVLLREEDADPFIEGRAYADEEYGWAKLMGEMTLRAYHRQHGLRGVSCRIFTSYGPRENETHAIIALIAKAFIQMDPYEVWGSGDQDRNFTYVDDTVEGLIRATEEIDDATPINIGTGDHITVKDATKLIFQLIGFEPRSIRYDTTKPEGVFSRAADLTMCKERLDWVPKTSFIEGLEKTIKWYVGTRHPQDVRSQLNELLYERRISGEEGS
jgi:UDP-glucose 4-epimerase